jgi:phosphate transport system substrate-binding protein
MPAVHLDLVSYEPQADVSGQLIIAGSETMQPVLAKLAAAFTQRHPQVNFTIEALGSTEGIREFSLGISRQRRGDKSRDGHDGGGAVNLLASSRRLTPEELKVFVAHHGEEPLEFPVAMDAVTIYVNTLNPIRGLTLEQIDAIFGSARKRGLPDDISRWGQLGLGREWNTSDIHLYGRNRTSGTREFFIETVLREGDFKDGIREQPGTATEILAIARDSNGIGYAGAGYRTSLVRVVPVAEQAGQPYIMPTADTVADGTYPLSRSLYLYVKKGAKDKLARAIIEFLKFASSQEGQQAVVQAGFFPLTKALIAKNMIILNGQSITASAVPASN